MPSGAISVTRVFDVSRQLPVNVWGPMWRSQRCSWGCQITLSRRLQGTWLPTRKRMYHSRRECTLAHTSSTWWCGRQAEEIEEVAFPQVHNDPVLKRNEKLHLVRDVKSRGMLSPTLSLLEHVGMFLCANPTEGCWYWMRDDRTPTFCPSWCATVLFRRVWTNGNRLA